MLTFISCAKTMDARGGGDVPFVTQPLFQDRADGNALEMARLSAGEMGELLGVNDKIAALNCLRYGEFLSPDTPVVPALTAYTGAVFKRIAPADFSKEDFLFAQDHLLVTSFLYGLLRPLDGIKPYRMEGAVKLPAHGGASMFDYWKPVLTDFFIERIKECGGVLVNLASDEMKGLFDWRRVESEVRVITPDFMVAKGGKLKTVVIYAKMCRGEMTRFIIKNRIDTPEGLEAFSWEGFRFCPEESGGGRLLFADR